MDGKPLTSDDTSLPGKEHDLAYYLDKFGHTPVTSIKKKIIRQLLIEFPEEKLTKIVDKLSTISDQYRFITYLTEAKEKFKLLEKLSVYNKLANIQSKINKEATTIFKEITSNDRKGKKFDGIVLGRLTPLINKNDSILLLAVLDKLANLTDSASLKKLHNSFIQNLKITFDIVQKIKNEGLSPQNIEKNLIEKQDKLLKPGMRTLFQNLILIDKSFTEFREPIFALLGKLTHEEAERNKTTDNLSLPDTALNELSKIRDVNGFIDKANDVLAKENQSFEQISSLFNLLLNKPLINILKLLKFPLDRELFQSWFKTAPLPTSHINAVEEQMENVNAEFEQLLRKQTPPKNEIELITLIYDFDINFTDKYNLISEAMTHFQYPEAFQFFLGQIKTTQYKIEHKLIENIINQLKECYTLTEIDNLFKIEKAKVKKHLQSYKQAFETNLTQIFSNVSAETQKILRQIVQEAKEEKIIPTSLILDLHKTLVPGKQFFFMAKMINFLLCYYLSIFGQWILAYWHAFFSHLKATDGLFIKNKLSSISKEEIYNFCCAYASHKDLIKNALIKYLKWGEIEKKAREHCLLNLGGSNSVNTQLSIGRYKFSVTKYALSYTVIIKDGEGKTRLAKTTEHIINYLDYYNMIHYHKIDTQLNITENQFKLLYQNAHLQYLDELEEYIRDRLKLLEDPLSGYTSILIREEYQKAADPHVYLEGLRKKGKEEIHLRELMMKKLKDELYQSEESKKEFVTRINRESGGHKYIINFRIKGLLRYIDKLEQKKLADSMKEEPVPPALNTNVEAISAKMQGLPPEEQAKVLTQELARVENEDDRVKTAATLMLNTTSGFLIKKTIEFIEKVPLDRYKVLISLYKILDRQNDAYVKLRVIDEFSQRLFEKNRNTFLEFKYYLDIQRKKIRQEILQKEKSLSQVWKELFAIKDNKEKIKYLESLLGQPGKQKYAQQLKCMLQTLASDNINEVINITSNLPVEDQLNALEKYQYYKPDLQLTPEVSEALDNKQTELEARTLLREVRDENTLSEASFDLLMSPQSDPALVLEQIEKDFSQAERIIIKESLTEKGLAETAIDKYLATNFKASVPAKKEQGIPGVPGEQNGKQSAELTQNVKDVKPIERTTEKIAQEDAKENFQELPNPVKTSLADNSLNASSNSQIFPDDNPDTFSSSTYENNFSDLGSLEEEQIQYDDEGELDETEPLNEKNITNIEQASALLSELKEPDDETIIASLEEKLKNNQVSEVMDAIKNELVLENAKQKNFGKMSRLLIALHKNEAVNKNKEIQEQVEQYIKTMEPVILESAKNELKNGHITMTTQQLEKKISRAKKGLEQTQTDNPKVNEFISQFSSLIKFTDLQTLLAKENFNQDEIKNTLITISKTMLEGNYIYLKKTNSVLGSGKLANLINMAFEQKLQGQTSEIDIELLKDAWNFIRNHSAHFNQFQLIGCSDQEQRKDLLIKLQQLSTGKTGSERFQPRVMKILKPIRQRERHETNIQHSLEESEDTLEQEKKERETRTFEASEDKIDFAQPDTQKMKSFVQDSYTPIINEWLTNMFKNKVKEDFVVVANGKKTYYTKQMLKAIVMEMLKRDIKGKAHVPLVNSLQKDDKLFDVLITELFDKQKTNKGYFVYFPKCLKSKK